jgi:phosphopantothenoylcysteine decarboxylase/phosphopantothenate--cysteine ligase
VSGPTTLIPPSGVELARVETSDDMAKAVLQRAPDQDVIVMAAAVADFKLAEASQEKLKRGGDLRLELTPTTDIAAEAAARAPTALHVGFALETRDLIEAARGKMRRKGQDLVVANAVTPNHNPFGSDSNQVTLVWPDRVRELPPLAKREVARLLWDEIAVLLESR